MSSLPNFRRVADATAEQWSGEEPDPGFMKSLNAISQYKQHSQTSKYWWIAVMALALALASDFLPFTKYFHGGLCLLTFFLATRAAFRAARAFKTASKADADADKKMKIGIIVADEDEKQPSPTG